MANQDTSKEDKQLPATERKLRNAREKGQVARSRDFGHLMVLGPTLLCLGLLGQHFSLLGETLFRDALTLDRDGLSDPAAIAGRLATLAGNGFMIFLPIAFVGMLGGIVAAVVPGGLIWSVKAMSLKWERLSPLSGLKRLFGVSHLIDSTKLSAMVAVLTLMTGLHVSWNAEQIVTLFHVALNPGFGELSRLILSGATLLIAILVLVASIDVPMQWFRFRAEMRMTREEMRKEFRETEGDPLLRARMRERQREIGRARMMGEVPSADVIVNNPTHYSVALRYEDGSMAAPRVVAKGVDHLAMRIREVGRDSGVPQLEAPALARALYAHVAIDQEVPSALYSAVAQVLAYVYRLKHQRDGRVEPLRADELAVPPELDPGLGDAGQVAD